MAIQKTPPLGWPHTEAAKHAPDGTREILRSHPNQPPQKKKSTPGCGCGCVIFILVILAIAGVLFAILAEEYGTDLADLTGGEATDFAAAEAAFLEEQPDWEVESADYPDTSGSVRLITWNYDRGIGRLAIMNPDPVGSGGWVESPMLSGAAEGTDDTFLDAFGEEFSDVRWSYVVGAEPSEEASGGARYAVYYHVQDEDSGDWTEMLTAAGELQRGMWAIHSAEASETTTTP